jgi:uncharacterized cupin superfamily protein
MPANAVPDGQATRSGLIALSVGRPIGQTVRLRRRMSRAAQGAPMDRPDCIRHWTELEGADNTRYPGDTELRGIGAPIGRLLGLTRLGIHHVRLLPGRRTSYPHAESAEEECVIVLEGAPDVWLDGYLHRLRAGDAVGFVAGTGLAHTFINDTGEEVRLLVIGEASKPENRIRYPMNEAFEATRPDRWADAPARPLGPHDGRPAPRA